MNKIRLSSIIIDMMINILSTGILLLIIQLLVFPFISRNMETENFGVILTIIGINNAVGLFLGNTLNNIRLLENSESDNGDFSFLLICSLIVSIFLNSILLYFYGRTLNLIEIVSLMTLSLITIIKNYALVYFRIYISYKNILLTNVFCISGYIIGVAIYSFSQFWPIIFLLGEGSGVAYLFIKTPILNEKPIKTANYVNVRNKYIQLASSSSISNFLVYMDRLVVNPILGPSSVATYYVASIIGKLISLIINPINNVLLTYISKMHKLNARNIFLKGVFSSIIVVILCYPITKLVTPLIITILYPDIFEAALDYIHLANLTALITVACSMISPFVLKFCPMKFQIFINLIYGAIYIFLSVILSSKYGLYGFCIAALISIFIKYIIILFTGILHIK